MVCRSLVLLALLSGSLAFAATDLTFTETLDTPCTTYNSEPRIAMQDKTFFVGLPGFDTRAGTGGWVKKYENGLSKAPSVVQEKRSVDQLRFGYSMKVISDVNSDGIPDLLVGAVREKFLSNGAGEMNIVSGSDLSSILSITNSEAQECGLGSGGFPTQAKGQRNLLLNFTCQIAGESGKQRWGMYSISNGKFVGTEHFMGQVMGVWSNSKGRQDMALVSQGDTVVSFVNAVNGKERWQAVLGQGSGYVTTAVADFDEDRDGDGYPEILLLAASGNTSMDTELSLLSSATGKSLWKLILPKSGWMNSSFVKTMIDAKNPKIRYAVFNSAKFSIESVTPGLDRKRFDEKIYVVNADTGAIVKVFDNPDFFSFQALPLSLNGNVLEMALSTRYSRPAGKFFCGIVKANFTL